LLKKPFLPDNWARSRQSRIHAENDPVNFIDPFGLFMVFRGSGDDSGFGGSNSCDGEMWPDGGDGFIPLSFACMNPPQRPNGPRDVSGGGGGQ